MAAVQDNAVEVTVKSPLGLHGRPAAHIVKLASNYNADVTVRNLDSGEVGDCSSILSLLVLAANHGTRLLLSATGADAAAALNAIADFFASGFNE